jgi:hypothetical protein
MPAFCVLRHGLAVHQPGHARGEVRRHFGADQVDSGVQLHRRQLGEGGSGEQQKRQKEAHQ